MKYITVVQAAERFGVSRQAVYQWIHKGRVIVVEGKGIDLESAEEYVRIKPKGRPINSFKNKGE